MIHIYNIALIVASKIYSNIRKITERCSHCGEFKAEKELPSGEAVCSKCYEKYEKTLCFYCNEPGIWRTNWGKYICEKCFPLVAKPMEDNCGCICDYCGERRADRIDRKSGMKLCPDCLRKTRMKQEEQEEGEARILKIP